MCPVNPRPHHHAPLTQPLNPSDTASHSHCSNTTEAQAPPDYQSATTSSLPAELVRLPGRPRALTSPPRRSRPPSPIPPPETPPPPSSLLSLPLPSCHNRNSVSVNASPLQTPHLHMATHALATDTPATLSHHHSHRLLQSPPPREQEGPRMILSSCSNRRSLDGNSRTHRPHTHILACVHRGDLRFPRSSFILGWCGVAWWGKAEGD